MFKMVVFISFDMFLKKHAYFDVLTTGTCKVLDYILIAVLFYFTFKVNIF